MTFPAHVHLVANRYPLRGMRQYMLGSVLVLLLILGFSDTSPVVAAPGSWQEKGERIDTDTGGGVSQEQAAQMVRERTGGRILSVETKQRDGREVHVVRILTERQRVRRLRIDAETGRFLGKPKRR